MRIEHLFSKLEARTSVIFRRIIDAVAEGRGHIDILEKDIQILFKFMNLSTRRSKQYRDHIESANRENDHIFQHLFEEWRKTGGSGEPGQFWLSGLLYLLETSHEDILKDAEKTGGHKATAFTYKHFIESYALQIWKAADNYEFFLNDRLVDFEGDTQSFLGVEVKDTRHQLTLTTTEDLIHVILPISPKVAVVFCNESRCWESPFADNMHQLKIPYPENTLLKNAPHKDIVNVHVPAKKRGKKRWPATEAWQINIGSLSQEHHRIVTSYSLSHAEAFVVVQRRKQFERARRELKVFNKKRAEVWESKGFRFSYRDTQQPVGEENPSEKQIEQIVHNHMSALDEMLSIITTTEERLPGTKENMSKSWLAIRSMQAFMRERSAAPSSNPDHVSSPLNVMHPALKAAFEAAYPPKHPNHRDLTNIHFSQFVAHGLGEENFARLTFNIDLKIRELVQADTFHTHWEACATELEPISLLENDPSGEPDDVERAFQNPAFRSVYRMAECFDLLKWMFEERQDILATFVKEIAGPMEAMQPRLIRIRARRE